MHRCGVFRQADMNCSSLKILNRVQIKYIVIIAMLIDHIAWAFVPTMSAAGQIMHFVGRFTAPTMSYMIAEGYNYTSNKQKYAFRLLLFSLISWLPYTFFEHGRITPEISVIFALFLGYMSIWVWDRSGLIMELRIIMVIVFCLLSVTSDWGIFAVLWPLFFYIYRDDEKKKWIVFNIIALLHWILNIIQDVQLGRGPLRCSFQIGVFFTPVLLVLLYNGKGGKNNAVNKWFFYIFYPLHLLILGLIKYGILW